MPSTFAALTFLLPQSPHKWIVSWFTRQRRKKAKKGPGGATSSDATLSPDQIMVFKTEYTDPLLETGVTPEQKADSKSKTKKAPGRPRKKVKTEALTALPRLQAKLTPQFFNPDRPILPSSDINNPCFNQNPPALHYTYNANSLKPESVATSRAQSSVPIAQKTVFTSTRRLPRTPFQAALHVNFESQSLQPHTQGPWEDFQTAQSSSRSAHQLATYGPLQEQPSLQQPHMPVLASSDKETYWPPLHLLPALLDERRTAFDDDTNDNQTSLGDYANYMTNSSPWDPTTTPLKHLEVLKPSSGAALEKEEVVERLLDERLAREDPFQASMGLVLLSRLGLGWDCQ